MKYIFLSLLCFCMAANGHAQPVKKHGQLKVAGTKLLDKNNDRIALHGMSFGWSCFHPRFYTAGTVEWLHKDWNCNVVRASLGVEPEAGYIADPKKSTKLITTVVDAAIKEGIYVIIDWHSHNINLKEAKIFFAEMAEKYAGHTNIIYELFNEPDYETWGEVKAYATEIIAVIRKFDKKNIILVGSPRWDQEIMMPADDPIKGHDNLMYTMHFYAGTHGKWLRERTDSALQKGLPVFISESAGMEATGDGPIDSAAWQQYIDWIDKNNLSWITWSVSDKNESCSVLNTSASSTGNWKETDLKLSGIKTRNYLKKYPKQ
ncbi:MAG: glycoside hydrolase family 5 protein [Ferruginibacter sp.]